MARFTKRCTVLASLLLLAACETIDPNYGGVQLPDVYSARGTWRGTSGSVSLNLTMKESEGNVTGDGKITSGSKTVAVTAAGTNIGNAIKLVMSAPGYADVSFRGDVARTTIAGFLNDSGFDEVPITLTKQ